MSQTTSDSSTPSLFSFSRKIILKILFSGCLIFWLFMKIDIHKVWQIIQNLQKSVLFLVLILLWITLTIVTKRWQLIIQLGDNTNPSPSFSKLLKATFIGGFFNQCFPSSIGGDFFRILIVRRLGASLNKALSSIIIDRLFGFIALSALSVFAISMEKNLLMESDLRWPFLITLLLVAGICIGILLLKLAPQSVRHQKFLQSPLYLAEMFHKVLIHKLAFLSIFIISLGASIVLILGLQILMMDFDISLSWQQSASVLSIVLLLTSLPISFAGWGLREGIMIIALGLYNVPQETALAFSISYGIIQLISGLPGLFLWILQESRFKFFRLSD